MEIFRRYIVENYTVGIIPLKKSSFLISISKGGFHTLNNSIAIKTKFIVHIRRIEMLETHSTPQVGQVNQL